MRADVDNAQTPRCAAVGHQIPRAADIDLFAILLIGLGGGEMNNGIRILHRPTQRLRIPHVGLDDFEAIIFRQPFRRFQTPHHRLHAPAALQQTGDNVSANETRGPGHQYGWHTAPVTTETLCRQHRYRG